VSEIAKRYGGGGHRGAAGFSRGCGQGGEVVMSKPQEWHGEIYWPDFGMSPLMASTTRESKDTPTLGKVLDAIEKMERIEKENPVAVEARAEPGTIALMERFLCENVPEMATSIMLHGRPGYYAGVPLREDANVPPGVVRFHDRRGAVIREVVIK
jgi:hypothetical protein